MTTFFRAIALCFSFAALSSPSLAQHANETSETAGPPATEPAVFTSSDSVRINGRTINYDVTAKETYFYDETDAPNASIFSFSYVAQGVTDPTTRPVMFVFNGGPGSASLWLHMGVVGPKIVDVATDGPEDDGAPPYPIIDNPHSLLDVADLVFIDPVGTGFSRILEDGDTADHWGVEEDARSVGNFIRRWLTENKRWGSPKYLAGESYGTTRAAALAEELTGGYNDVALNGILLISAILDFEGSRGFIGEVGLMPTHAALGWYYNRVDRSAWNDDMDAFLADARDFASDTLAPALLKGQALSDEEEAAIIAQYSDLTGLSEEYLDRANMRVDVGRFMKEYLRDQGLTLGRFDGRYTGTEVDNVGEYTYDDPSGYAMDAAFTGSMNDYMTRYLGIDITRPYKVLPWEPGTNWKSVSGGGSTGPGYTNVVPGLGTAMRHNREMRVLLASGYYDQATPFFAAELSLQAHGVPQDRVIRTYYEAGHMMYLERSELEQLSIDMHAFVRGE